MRLHAVCSSRPRAILRLRFYGRDVARGKNERPSVAVVHSLTLTSCAWPRASAGALLARSRRSADGGEKAGSPGRGMLGSGSTLMTATFDWTAGPSGFVPAGAHAP